MRTSLAGVIAGFLFLVGATSPAYAVYPAIPYIVTLTPVVIEAVGVTVEAVAEYKNAANQSRYVRTPFQIQKDKLTAHARDAFKKYKLGSTARSALAWGAVAAAVGLLLDGAGEPSISTGQEEPQDLSNDNWHNTNIGNHPSYPAAHEALKKRQCDIRGVYGTDQCVVERVSINNDSNGHVQSVTDKYMTLWSSGGSVRDSWTLTIDETSGNRATAEEQTIEATDQDVYDKFIEYSTGTPNAETQRDLFYGLSGDINRPAAGLFEGLTVDPIADPATAEKVEWMQQGTAQSSDPAGANYVSSEEWAEIEKLANDKTLQENPDELAKALEANPAQKVEFPDDYAREETLAQIKENTSTLADTGESLPPWEPPAIPEEPDVTWGFDAEFQDFWNWVKGLFPFSLLFSPLDAFGTTIPTPSLSWTVQGQTTELPLTAVDEIFGWIRTANGIFLLFGMYLIGLSMARRFI